MREMESIVEILTETRRKLLKELNFLSFEELNASPGGHTWSVSQVCHHLYLAEKSFAKAIRFGVKQNSLDKIEPKPIQNYLTDRAKKVNAPDFVNPGEEPLEIQLIIQLLHESRAFLLDTLSKIEDYSVLEKKSFKHPLFGELPLHQWIEVVYLHEQRHIEQIKEIKSLILNH